MNRAELAQRVKNLHVQRLGRIKPRWGVFRLPKAIYVAAFGRGISIRWVERWP